MNNSNIVITVVGLGYVGLPLAVEFGKKYRTLGFDPSETKIANYNDYIDETGEVSTELFKEASQLTCSTDPAVIQEADVVIVAVPTPVNVANTPDFSALKSASKTVGKYLKKGATVVYESTVHPGATEDFCVPLLESCSGMKWKEDFSIGYSPERVNPGDKEKTITKIIKIVSGDSEKTCDFLSKIYGSIISAGIYQATSIKVAEAAKVIENIQRDINIALINELAMLFGKMNINIYEVLAAAGSKWNFLPFKPGLVGGHCIGVDPYYLTYKAEQLGYHPQIIKAGRRINDSMASYAANRVIKKMIASNISIKQAKINVLGVTFKQDCPDIRNSKVVDLIRELEEFGCQVSVHDPLASKEQLKDEYQISLYEINELPRADAVIMAVPHKSYSKVLENRAHLELVSDQGIFFSLTDPKGLILDGCTVNSIM